MSLGNYKLEHWDTTTHLLEKQQSKTLTVSNADEDVKQQNSHLLLLEMQNGTATLEDSLVIYYKTKHTPAIGSSSHDPWYVPKWTENFCIHKCLDPDIYSSFIHNCHKLEATKISQ